MKRRGRKSEPVAVGSMVTQVLSELGLAGTASAVALSERWEEIVGSEIAAHCQPIIVRDGVLEASVDSSVWCQQLQLQREEILEALRRALGPDAPKDLWLRVG